jgi:hypothetical protein
VSGIISLISFSAYSLLLFRKATDFCILLLVFESVYETLVFWWGFYGL